MIVAEMFTVYPAANISVDAHKLKIAGYVNDLAGLPAWAVKAAGSKWRRGEVSGEVKFAPSSGEWRRLAEAQTLDHRAQINRLKRVLAAQLLANERPSVETRAKVAQKFGDLLTTLAKSDETKRAKA